MQKNQLRNINGIFLLDKPIGLSSNQALQRAKKIYAAKKAGHTGSLDVLASGLLPLCFGEATKFSQFLLEADKVYFVRAKLGERTATCDREGEVTETKPTDHINLSLIEEILKKYRGEVSQIPSMYSALKHHGQPLYKLARQNIEVEREPRIVNIYDLTLVEWTQDTLALSVHCSKGTYVRNLVDDIGQDLNCGAYVTELRRLKAGPFSAEQMITLEQLEGILETGGYPAIDQLLLPVESTLAHFPILEINASQTRDLQQGKTVPIETSLTGCVQLVRQPHQLLGVGEISDGVLTAKRLIRQ